MSDREPTAADHFMATARALGLSLPVIQEGLDLIAAAEVRSTANEGKETK